MGSTTRLPKIQINQDSLSDSSSEYEDDTDSDYGDVDILKLDCHGRERFKKVGFYAQRPKTASNRERTVTSTVARPWSSTLRQPDPRWGKRLLLRRQSTEEYLEEMSDEMFDRVNRLSRSTAATMARDASKPVKPYQSPREKKKPLQNQPSKTDIDYTYRFTGTHRLRDGDIKDVVNRLYKVNTDSKKVNQNPSRLGQDVTPRATHNRRGKLLQNRGDSRVKSGFVKPLSSYRQLIA